jgi:hypothetical protein
VLADEHPLARDTIWMAAGAGLMLVKRIFRCKAAIANITLPFRFIAGLMGSAVVDVLEIPVVGVEPAIARSAVRHRGVVGLMKSRGMWRWILTPN